MTAPDTLPAGCAAHERAIARAARALVRATTRAARVRHWHTLKTLHAERSPVTIERMEIEQGLR